MIDKMKHIKKSVVVCLTALAIVLSSFVSAIVTFAETSEVWDGTVAEEYAGGSGTQTNPYIIKTAEQLARLVNDNDTAGKYYKLDRDIVINEKLTDSAHQWYSAAVENGTGAIKGSVFKGSFDGSGHTVSGIYFKGNATDNAYWYTVGLFPRADAGAVIENVGVINSSVTVTGGGHAGAIVGVYSPASSSVDNRLIIEKCFADETVSITAPNAGGIAGALNGAAYVYDCYFTGKLSGNSNGAIYATGWSESTHIYRFYSTSALKKHGNEYYEDGSVYSTAGTAGNIVSLSDITGNAASGTLSAFDFAKVWATVNNGTPALRIFGVKEEDPQDGSWSGNMADTYAAGDGTSKAPYEIETAEQLARLVNDGDTAGKYYKLTADIVINKTLGSNSKNWYSVLSDSTGVSFQGDFDGNGHTVSGLYYNGSNNGYWFGVGLFPRIDEGAKIRNVGITNSSITVSGSGTAGALVGYLLKDQSYATAAKRPTVESCYADESATVTAPRAGGIIGTAVGECQFKNIYFTGSVSGASCGALYGTHWSNYVLIDYFYSTAPIYLKDANRLSNVYATHSGKNDSNPKVEPVIVELSAITGAGALDAMPEFDYTGTWKTVDGKTPVLRVFEGTAIREDGIWSGITADSYEGGSGTEADPYKIATAEQLARLINDTDTAGKYYALTADIKLNDVSKKDWYSGGGNNEWYSVNDDKANHFNGNFDGNGHTVSGLYYGKTPGRDGYRSALFPMIGPGAVIRNVGVVNSYLSGFGNVAAIAGWSRDNLENGESPVITGCYADESVIIKGMRTAGMVAAGSLSVNISNCYFNGKLEATEKVYGAMTAYFWAPGISISNCYSAGSPIYYSKDGSASNFVLKNCYSTVAQNGITTVSAEDMRETAEKQKSVFAGFDFVSVWSLSDGRYPALRVIPANYGIGAVGEVWSGNIAKEYAAGDGTKSNPYIIETAAQLAKLIKDTDTVGKYYKLTADILLNDTTASNWHQDGKNTGANVWFSVNDDKANQFNGYFEGDGHIVSGIYYNNTPGKDGYRSGLFPMIGQGAVIRNVGVVNSYMSCFANAGAIVGWSNVNGGNSSENPVNPVISGCYADDTVIIKGMRVAGIVGAGSLSVDIDNCYFTGSLTATEKDSDGKTPKLAGIACYFWAPGNNIVNSYTVDYPIYTVSGTANFSIRDCYSNVEQSNVRTRTKAQMTGEAAKRNMPAFDWNTIWKTSSKTPVLIKVPEGYQANGYNGRVGEIWSGQVASAFAGGDGSENNPYLISTGEQLAKFVTGILDKPNANGVYYKLTTDIYLNDTSKSDWKDEARSWYFSTWGQYESSKGFRGVFDGDGHVVSGLYLNVENNGQVLGGLIPVIGEGGTVKNVGVVNSYLRGYDNKYGNGWLGAICGYAYDWEMPADNDGTGHMAAISGCFADTTVTVSGQMAGGILGATPRAILIENCYFTGTLLSETDGKIGGIIGYNWSGVIESPVKNCYTATAAKDSAIGKCFDTTKCENVYCTVATPSGGRILSLKSMRGENAEKYMTGFDFKNVWYACKDGTPVLRAFGTSSKYSNTSPFDKICITFVTNGGNEIDPIYGEEGSEIQWPEVTRKGYEFEGWYVYRELDVKFPLNVFPMNNITLYAKWKSLSIEQGFERNYDTALLGNDYELYKLGMPGFSFDFVHGGTKSVHRIGKSSSDSSFVPFDSSNGELVPGKEYDLTMWVYVETENTPVKLSIGQINKASLSAKEKNVRQLADISADKAGAWQEVSLTFVAEEKYLKLTSSGGCSIYFDDLVIMPTGKTGTVSNTDKADTASESGSTNIIIYIVIIASAVIVAGAAAAAVIYFKKRKTLTK